MQSLAAAFVQFFRAIAIFLFGEWRLGFRLLHLDPILSFYLIKSYDHFTFGANLLIYNNRTLSNSGVFNLLQNGDDDETTRRNSDIESIWCKDKEKKNAVYSIKKNSKESPRKPITSSSFDTCGNIENIRAPETQAVSTTPGDLIKQSVGKKNSKYRNSSNIETHEIWNDRRECKVSYSTGFLLNA